jgi:hydrogenase maturation protein HypF
LADESANGVRRREVLVRGVVQGVGFRPFVYRLASEEQLAGFIGNDTDGVRIEIEGSAQSVENFLLRLQTEAPPLARIDSVVVREVEAVGALKFEIILSEVRGRVSTGIPADAATCPDCLRELLDPADRRYRYPFLNCTNCGPRYTITRRIPYDRPQTSMAKFPMCPACQAEYDDPLNRRFHAQPNACWQCGPKVWLVDGGDLQDGGKPGDGSVLKGHGFRRADEASETGGALASEGSLHSPSFVAGHDFSRAAKANKETWALAPAEAHSDDSLEFAPPSLAICNIDPVAQTIRLLAEGRIVAIKGIGGFHLSVDATNEEAVLRLRERKHRYGKPLAVMVRDLDAARAVCRLSPEEEALLTTPARPIVLARRRAAGKIAASVAPGIPWLGLFLPYAPLQHLLFAGGRITALVMTSANLSEEPIAIDNEEAQQRLCGIADAFLLHDREILQRCDDSVMAIVDGAPQLMRRARGFVPLAVSAGPQLPLDAPPLLAVGGHLKNVFALASGRFVYQSQHLGDLENLTGLAFFRESLDHLMRTFEIEPQTVVHDLHPGYLSTAWAKEWAAERGLPLIAVQHHHAHVAGCLAEHGIQAPVIGLALDGTGHGTDGKIWGGEVLIAGLAGFERFAHLEYVPLPGGEKAIREPWRVAFAALRAAGIGLDEATALTGAGAAEARVLERMIERGVNAPLTSSLGRLFDAVAAVVLQRRVVDYEAQAAIELEGVAVDEDDRLRWQGYVPELFEGRPLVLRTDGLWQTLINDLRHGLKRERISAAFHAGIAEGLIWAVSNARETTGIGQVVLSGGCMHNRRLARLLRKGLEEEGFEVFQHRAVSPGDGGLSYGQAVVATAQLAKQR